MQNAAKFTPVKVEDDLLERSVTYLIFNEPFYANLLLNMSRMYTVDIPTVGVNVTEQVNLYVNPYFWRSLSLPEQVDVLKHECLHVINNHFARFQDLEPEAFEETTLEKRIQSMLNAPILNQAADYAINELLPNLPKKMQFFDKQGNPFVEPDKIKDKQGNEIANPDAGKPRLAEPCLVALLKKKFPKVDHKQAMEYYYEFLHQNMPKQQMQMQSQSQGQGQGQGQGKPQQGQGNGAGTPIDDHGIWAQGNTDPEYVTEKVKQVVNKAVEETQERSAGSIPGDLMELIHKLNYKPRDWRQDLQRFVARTAEIVIESSRKVRNRRYGIMFPGYKIYPKLHIAVLTDTSGSVGDEELNQFFAEIERIHKNNVEITVVEFDAKVNGVFKFDPRKEIKVHGRGGTHFKPGFEEARKLDVDGIICFTDGGDCYNDCEKPKVPVLWALVGNNAEQCLPYKWGSRTKITVKKKFK